jgi:hypothetical protein
VNFIATPTNLSKKRPEILHKHDNNFADRFRSMTEPKTEHGEKSSRRDKPQDRREPDK